MNRSIIIVGKWLLVAIGLYALVTRLWACEDAYISFRYIDNWLNGLGLVYNIGDRVEGFTHPLWLFIVAIPSYFGMNIRTSALLLSLIISLVALALIAFYDRDRSDKQLAVPLAAVLLLTHTGYRDFSVSGLELPLVVLLLVWFYISYKRYDLLSKPILHGSLLALIYLTRPELILLIIVFYCAYGITIVSAYRHKDTERALKDLKGLLRLSVPIIAIAGGYHLFRGVYYGELFPNTYFAKRGLDAYWSHGWVYLKHSCSHSPIQMTILAACTLVAATVKKIRHVFATSLPRKIMLLQIAVLVVYVARLGGDFMAFRFLLPALTIAAVLVNDIPNYLLRKNWQVLGLGGAVILTAFFVVRPITTPQRIKLISDERQFYDVLKPAYRALFEDPTEHKWFKLGIDLKHFQDSIDFPIILAAGNIGYLGYAAGPKVYILDVYGLVDRFTARATPIAPYRGRPGHEARLDIRSAVERRATYFDTRIEPWTAIMGTPFGDIITVDPKLLRYYPEKVDALKKLKHEAAESQSHSDAYFILKDLETIYGVDVDSLPGITSQGN